MKARCGSGLGQLSPPPWPSVSPSEPQAAPSLTAGGVLLGPSLKDDDRASRVCAEGVSFRTLPPPSASTEPPRSASLEQSAGWGRAAGRPNLLAGQRDETLVSIHIAVYNPASAFSAEAVTREVPTPFNIRPITCEHGGYMSGTWWRCESTRHVQHTQARGRAPE